MPKIIFVNRVYWPSTQATAQILRDLTVALASAGLNVQVITSTPLSGDYRDEITNLEVLRTSKETTAKTNLLAKFCSYSRFLKSTRHVLGAILRKNDVVVAMTDPPMLGANIAPLVRDKGGEMWHWSQDLYPEVALAIKPFGVFTKLLEIYKRRRNAEWRKAKGIVAIGCDMKQRIVQNGISDSKVLVSANWAPRDLKTTEPNLQRTKWNVPTDSFVISYSGNLGRAHVLTPILDLVDALKAETCIHTVIVGHGAQKNALKTQAHDRLLERCIFQDPVPISELGNSLSAADIHLITMRPDCVGTVWPSKFYGIIAAQRPIVFIGPKSAEVASLIAKHELGIAVEPSDIVRAADFIAKLAGDPKLQLEFRGKIGEFAKQQAGLDDAIALWTNVACPQRFESESVATRPKNA